MKIILIGGIALITFIVGLWWSQNLQANDPDVVSQVGIHWHPTLAIYVKGVKQEIPANIGIGSQHAGTSGYDPQMRMAAVHTHDATGVIHFEFTNGPVRKEDLTLGQFFKIWGEDMRSFGQNMRMTLNGKENTEYENYVMRDGDKIELSYE
ncbi:MAG: hypothetical protein HYV67_01365 [Candidatus Taylorbacteria bacterium]|nr:hypothetical protein [Candidatus Taylorbacteria bacterium]